MLSLSFWLLSLQLQGNSVNPQLNHIFNSLKQVEDSTIQASMLRGTLVGLSGKRDIAAPAAWKPLRIKLARSKDPEVIKLADQLSQIFGDLSVSEDALKLVMNGDANLKERKEALSGLVAMRYEELPENLNLLLDSRLKVDAIRAYSFFNYPELRERLIVLEGWSKAYSMTGWRLGWSFWPKELVPHVNKLLINSVSCVNAAAQFAGIAALDGPDDSINEMMVKFTERRKLIHEGLNSLPGVECSLPGGAFYAFPNVKGTGMNGSEFSKKCMHEAGVAIVPGTAFGKTSIDYVRFSFAASQDNIQKALEKIGKMLK